VYFL